MYSSAVVDSNRDHRKKTKPIYPHILTVKGFVL